MINFRIIIILFFCFPYNIYSFSNISSSGKSERDSLLIEIRRDFNNVAYEDIDEAMDLFEIFDNKWHTNQFSRSQKETIRNTFAGFENMRLSTWPDKGLYIEVLLEVINTPNSAENFKGLHESFDDLLSINRQRRFLILLEKSLDLFKNNILYKSYGVKWRFDNNDYVLVHDSVPDITKVEFKNRGNLICYSQNDSSIIRETTGTFFLYEDKWEGSYGKFTWERVKLGPDEVYAEFDNYNLNLTRPRFNIDSVRFYNKNFFSQHLEGELDERIVSDVSPEDATHPRFTSYKAILEIEELFPGINYFGGFSMQGQKVLGSSSDEEIASIDIYRNDTLFVTAKAQTFSITHNQIISRNAAVSLYLRGDSIYHPGINMRYIDDKHELALLRSDKGASQAPFQNNYHNIYMYCEALYWDISTDIIELRIPKGKRGENVATFESDNFFSDIRYMRLQGMEDMHPLVRLSRFSRQIGSREFPIKNYARHRRQGVSTIRHQINTLSHYGFLSIKPDGETIVLNDLLFHYTGSYPGNRDFDVMNLDSEARINAEINLSNFDMEIHGIDNIPLSDTKNVIIHPYGGTVTMQENRDINFDGRIESGTFDFYGRDFSFEYDSFRIELVDTDSMGFSVRSHEPDSRGQYSQVRVKTVLEGINGELLIDDPDNKSGKLRYPSYPIFNSNSESYVYYDHIFDGVYDREDLYFKIVPFSIDSLDQATADNIVFEGVHVFTGIFPEFSDKLTVQRDYSLGFDTQTPDEGFPIYGTNTVYHGPISMSYEGLRAPGRLEYLNTTIEAKDMIMFPDSAVADVNTLTLDPEKKGPVKYPRVNARDVDMLYLPYEDDLSFDYRDNPIEIYEGFVKSRGSLSITPDGLYGSGDIELLESEMFSEDFIFRENDIEAKEATLKIKTPAKTEFNFEFNEYDTFIDIPEKTGSFKASGDSSFVDMPVNEYIAYMDELRWDYDSQKIAMNNQRGRDAFELGNLTKKELIDVDFEGFEFVSTHQDQDSLSFYVDSAVFNQRNSEIHAEGVKIIKVADAAIYPFKEELRIYPEGEIGQLQNTTLIADTAERHHYLYEANITINSRNHYRGEAYYDYINDTGEEQKLFFERLSVNNEGQTYGISEVDKESDFFITSKFPFKGDINLTAPEKELYYEGATKILAEDCGLLQPGWLRFEAKLHPDSIMIPVGKEPQNVNYDGIKTSIMLAGDSAHVYPAIFSRRKHYLDREVLTASGFLTYDSMINQYVLTTAEKHQDNSLPDNLIRLDPNSCRIRGEGDVTFHDNDHIGQVEIESFGNVNYDLADNQLELDIVMTLDFFFSDDCLDIIRDTIEGTTSLREINLNRQKYIKAMYNIFGVEEGSSIIEEDILSGPSRRFPSELNKTFFFADIKLKWNQNTTSFVSDGPLGIGNIQNNTLNKYVDGFFQYSTKRRTDALSLYFEPKNSLSSNPGGVWFYFYYNDEVMKSISTLNEYNNTIYEIRNRRKRLRVSRGEPRYSYRVAPDNFPFIFFREMNEVADF